MFETSVTNIDVTIRIHLTAVKRGILEHYKYDEIKKFNPAFVCEKLKELFDVHVGRSQVALYMSRTSWLKYNPEKKCYEVSDIFVPPGNPMVKLRLTMILNFSLKNKKKQKLTKQYL